MPELVSLDVSKSLMLFRCVPLDEWLILSTVSKVINQWFEQDDLWQEACRISARRAVEHQGVNDVSFMAPCALFSIASKLQRISLRRTKPDVICSKGFPALSPVHITRCDSFWVLGHSDVVPNDTLLGSKRWEGGDVISGALAQPRDHWPAGLSALVGSTAIELGAGLGLVSLAVARFCCASRVVLTDIDVGCLHLAGANISINALPTAVETRILRFGAPTKDLRASFDVVIAADVAYSLELVDPLWRSVNALLRKAGGTFIVSHLDRTPSGTARLVSCATLHGFRLKHQHDLWTLQVPRQKHHSFAAWLFIFERVSAKPAGYAEGPVSFLGA